MVCDHNSDSVPARLAAQESQGALGRGGYLAFDLRAAQHQLADGELRGIIVHQQHLSELFHRAMHSLSADAWPEFLFRRATSLRPESLPDVRAVRKARRPGAGFPLQCPDKLGWPPHCRVGRPMLTTKKGYRSELASLLTFLLQYLFCDLGFSLP